MFMSVTGKVMPMNAKLGAVKAPAKLIALAGSSVKKKNKQPMMMQLMTVSSWATVSATKLPLNGQSKRT